jgi:pyruvate/2-oxoglutarate dehydrogenase complex dihydrolipoamide acyltransferase (E2) component
MARIEIRVPSLGEATPQAVVARWLRQPGAYVTRDEAVAELSTEKADVEVAASEDGWLAEIRAPDGAVVVAGDVLALLETEPGRVAAVPAGPPKPPEIRCIPCGVPMEPANASPSGLPFENRVRLLVCRTCGRVQMVAEDPRTF